MKKRVRDVPIYVWVRPDELAAIRARMDEAGIRNLSAYIRKMPSTDMCSMLTSPPFRSLFPSSGGVPTI